MNPRSGAGIVAVVGNPVSLLLIPADDVAVVGDGEGPGLDRGVAVAPLGLSIL